MKHYNNTSKKEIYDTELTTEMRNNIKAAVLIFAEDNISKKEIIEQI